MIAFVGSTQNHNNGATFLTLSYNTAGGGTTAGNLLVACVQAASPSTPNGVTGITIGGSADNWAKVVSADTWDDAAIWMDPNCAGGQTSITITGSFNSTPQINAFIMEFSGVDVSPLDAYTSSAADSNTSSYDSGGVATAGADEVWVGMAGGIAGVSFALNAPASPWTSMTVINNSDSGTYTRALAGYQIVSSAGTADWSGTFDTAVTNGAAVATFKAAGGGLPHLAVPGPQAVRRAAYW